MLSARWREMDGNSEYPPPKINRSCDSTMLSHHSLNQSKKRKLLTEGAEKSDSPALKHTCSTKFDILSEDALHSRDNIHGKKTVGKDIPNGNHADLRGESAEDNTSSEGTSFQGTVVNFNSDYQREQADGYPIRSWSQSGTAASTSSSSSNSGTTTITGYVIDESLISPIPSTGHGETHEFDSEMHDELIIDEPGAYMDIIALALGEEGKEKTDDELQEFIYSNGLIPESHILSTLACNGDDAEAQQLTTARKPTIDQEFEDYFSSLML